MIRSNSKHHHIALVTSATVTLAILLIRRKAILPSKKYKDGKRFEQPPVAKSSFYNTVRAIVSKKLPYHLLQWAIESGQIFQLRVPFVPFPMVVVSGNVALCREVLNDKSSIKTPGGFKVFKEKVMNEYCDDLISAEGAYWKHSRKHIAPAFSNNHVTRMNEVVITKTKEFMTKLDYFAERGESFDVGNEMIHLTLSIISETAFEYHMSEQERNMFVTELQYVLNEAKKGKMPFRWKLKSFIPSVRRARQAGFKLRDFGCEILDAYRKLKNPQKGTVAERIVNNPEYSNDMERANDLLVLLVGGHETTANAIARTLLELAKNEEEQVKLQRELMSMHPKERPNSDALQFVIKESLRVKSITPVGSVRKVTHDFYVEKNEQNGLEENIFIPKNSAVICSQVLLNHNAQYYDNPNMFKPSRWANPSKEALNSFMPFSLGRRNCIGQSLAKAEMRNVLSYLCTMYHFTLDCEGEEGLGLTHYPVNARLFVTKLDT